jgi:hypothetical protein
MGPLVPASIRYLITYLVIILTAPSCNEAKVGSSPSHKKKKRDSSQALALSVKEEKKLKREHYISNCKSESSNIIQ